MSEDEEKKIIIDEDWKSQVERERAELEEPKSGEESTADDMQGDIPPASFAMLITAIGSQAMLAMGQIPDPATGKATKHPDLARHHIDTLEILQQKTKGNLDAEEQQMLDAYLNQLRQMFITQGMS